MWVSMHLGTTYYYMHEILKMWYRVFDIKMSIKNTQEKNLTHNWHLSKYEKRKMSTFNIYGRKMYIGANSNTTNELFFVGVLLFFNVGGK